LFFLQNLGVALLQSVPSAPGSEAVGAGVAVMSHLGGFAAGMLLIKPLLSGRTLESKVWQGFRPTTKPTRFRRW
jgi:membrane associated rhomboid family serine protease